MHAPSPSVLDRRRHPRHKVDRDLSVELRVEVSGESPSILLTRRKARDISLGGVCCGIDFNVPVGTRVKIRFTSLPEGVSVRPVFIDGRVVRVDSVGGAPERVAIAFAEPLAQVSLAPDRNRPARSAPTSTSRSSSGLEPFGFSPQTVGGAI